MIGFSPFYGAAALLGGVVWIPSFCSSAMTHCG